MCTAEYCGERKGNLTMDDRVKALLSRVRQGAEAACQAAGTTVRYAGERAGSLVDITKLNLQIFDLNGEIADLLQQAGQVVYTAHQGGETDEGYLEGLLEELDGKNRQVDELKDRVAQLKSSRPCPDCGTLCGKEDRFCKHCGVKLD